MQTMRSASTGASQGRSRKAIREMETMEEEKGARGERYGDAERTEMSRKVDRMLLCMRHSFDMQLMVFDITLSESTKTAVCLVLTALNFLMLICLLLGQSM